MVAAEARMVAEGARTAAEVRSAVAAPTVVAARQVVAGIRGQPGAFPAAILAECTWAAPQCQVR